MENWKHEYMMLSRYQSDMEYYLGHGNRCEKHLYFGNFKEHIEEMFKLWEELPVKPEWLTFEKLNQYKNS